MIRVPMAVLPVPCNVVRMFHVKCNRPQAEKLRALRDALWDSDTKLKDGKPVNSPARTVQWLIENMKAVDG